MPAMPGFYNLPRSRGPARRLHGGQGARPHRACPTTCWPAGARRPPTRSGARRERLGAGHLPAGEVRAMFDRIAPRYDRLNRAMTVGLDGRWRRAAAAAADLAAGDRALDCCTGTGDLAFELAARVTPSGEVVGHRLRRGDARAGPGEGGRAGAEVEFRQGDALALPVRGRPLRRRHGGLRHPQRERPRRGLAEMARVVRPGGRVVILEITTPARLRRFYDLWFGRVVPRLGRPARPRLGRLLVPAGVGAAVPRAARAGGAHGRGGARWTCAGAGLAGGIIALHHGRAA